MCALNVTSRGPLIFHNKRTHGIAYWIFNNCDMYNVRRRHVRQAEIGAQREKSSGLVGWCLIMQVQVWHKKKRTHSHTHSYILAWHSLHNREAQTVLLYTYDMTSRNSLSLSRSLLLSITARFFNKFWNNTEDLISQHLLICSWANVDLLIYRGWFPVDVFKSKQLLLIVVSLFSLRTVECTETWEREKDNYFSNTITDVFRLKHIFMLKFFLQLYILRFFNSHFYLSFILL